MKAKDFIDIIEFTKAFKEPKEARRRKKIEPKEMDITALLHRELEKSEALTKLLKDYEKANKKEDKKPEDKWSTPQIAMLLMFVTFPPYLILTLMFLHR